MNKQIKILLFFLSVIFASINVNGQISDSLSVDTTENINVSDNNLASNDSLFIADSIPNDSIPIRDSLIISDSVYQDTITPFKKDNSISDPIDFSARDSMYISVSNKNIILFGEGKLQTIDMELQADSIGLNMDKKELKAIGIKDSTGRKQGEPVFKEQDKEYSATDFRYNFDSKKGLIHNVITQEQDGYLHGEIVKIHSNDEMHIYEGKYTTCNHKHPHYYIDLTKAKLKSKKQIITGPFYFVIMDIPIPIFAPFGFFPLSQENSSGISLPTYKDEIDLGFGLVGTGYYWAVNDYLDLDMSGDIYSKGSWGVHLVSRFKKRYKFNGNANINFFHKRTGERDLATTDISNTYSIQLSYMQDPKARPNSNFSTSINYSYGDYQKYNSTDINQFVNTTTTSSIAYQKNFSGTPFRMSANMNMSQNLADSTTNLKFPTMSFNMNKIFPAQKIAQMLNKNTSSSAWYNKIGISFTSSLANSVYTHDTILRNINYIDSTMRAMKSGFKYNVPIQTSFRIFKYLNVSPSFNYTGKIYPYKIDKNLVNNSDTSFVDKDTIWGFNHLYDFRTGVSVNTRLYGMMKLGIGRLDAIRHVITPSISYNYKPDFSDERWGYYEREPLDSTKYYSYYDKFLYGTAPAGEQQAISFSLGNNFEAKLSAQDTTKKEQKVKLIDNLSFSESYNFAADSMNLSNMMISASMRPIPKTSVSFNSTIDPYTLNTRGQRINKFELIENNKIGRLTSSTLTINTQFSSQDFNKKSENKSLINWNASVGYSFRYSKSFNVTKQEYDINITQNSTINFNISPTPLWDVSVRTGYDFNESKITSTTFNFHRDLHCWEMSLQLTPFGRMKSYMFKINIVSPMFEAIQVKRQRSWHDNF